ncbi:MAG TPA: TIGR03086 family metal-binding protein [Acidimicrobiia bacterium]|nr:TIGR03086 family metal-binding protein [Acidimicrobiia bacterium]
MNDIDLEPAARRLADLIAAVPDELLDEPTPCPDYRLGDLLEHIDGLALAFAAAARKDIGEVTARPPSGDTSRLPADWRRRIPQDLLAMAEAWKDPAAWDGMTQAGGTDLPAGLAGMAGLDELVLHGWDVARVTGQEFGCDPASLEVAHNFVAAFSGPGMEEQRRGLFGPSVAVPDGASLLDRVLGLSGRDPGWKP